jgi:outer membrane protein TolC
MPTGWAQQSSPPARLTLLEAIELGLKSNLGVLVAGTDVAEAGGTLERRRAALLPRISADHVTSYQNHNLQAMGISVHVPLPGFVFPTVVGPISNYDYRIFASQPIVDRQATHAARAGERQQDAAKLSYQDVRDQVVRQAAGLYLMAEANAAQLEAAEARVAISKTLTKLAQDQRGNGLATGLDVVRAQVQLQRDEQSLLVARNAYQTSVLNLQRYLGLQPGAPLELADRLAFHPLPAPDAQEMLRGALDARADYRSLRAQRAALVEQQKSSRARYLPRLTADGNYGALGRTYSNMPGIGTIEATVAITVFDRDRNGEQQELASRIERVDRQIADLERGIAQETQQAALDLSSAEQQVSVTEAGLALAERELELARDRFQNGLTDTVEVVTAQSSLQSAQDDRIQSLARHEDAIMELIRALGGTEKIYQSYLGGAATTETQPHQEAR